MNPIVCFVPVSVDSLFDNFQTDTLGVCGNDWIDIYENTMESFSTHTVSLY